MIMLCATPAYFKDRIFVTAYSYKLQTGSEPCLACVPASPPLVTRDLSFLEPSRASRASSGTVLPSATGQVPAARPSSVKPALSQPRCVKALCHFSPFYPHPCLLYPSPALPLFLTQLSHHDLQAITGTPVPPWQELSGGVGTVCICYFYSFFCSSICRDLGLLPDVRIALEDSGRSQELVPRPQHLPPPSPCNFCPSLFPQNSMPTFLLLLCGQSQTLLPQQRAPAQSLLHLLSIFFTLLQAPVTCIIHTPEDA